MRYNKKIESTPNVEIMNYAGGNAYASSPKNELAQRVLTWFVGEPKFYLKPDAETARIKALIKAVAAQDPEWVLKLAVYARNYMNLRTAPLFILVEALDTPAKRLVRPYVPVIIQRADEIPEVLAMFIERNGDVGKQGKASLPNQFKLGLSDAYSNFDEYGFGKYKENDKNVSQSDAIRIVHPKPRNDTQNALFSAIRHDTVPAPETWEVIVSKFGSNKAAWEMSIPKMGYMAKLRNLKNFLEQRVELDAVIKHLTNEKAIKNSRQFPYRFYSAYKMIDRMGVIDPFAKAQTLKALNEAMNKSVENIPRLEGKTAIFVDLSGSMKDNPSKMSDITMKEIASVMAASANRFCDNAIIGMFADRLAIAIPKTNDILILADEIQRTNVGGSTMGYLTIQYLLREHIKVDRVMIFTDMQMYGGDISNLWNQYRRDISPKAKLYCFDLHGYGQLAFPTNDYSVLTISGFSDKVFEAIPILEGGVDKVIKCIDSAVVEKYSYEEDI